MSPTTHTQRPSHEAATVNLRPATSAATMQELSRDECFDLLAAHRFGRLAVVLDGRPLIRPVNYVFDRRLRSIVFRTARGSKLHAVLQVVSASFEIDGIDEVARTGWSVVIEGSAAEMTEARDVKRLHALGVEPWAPGQRSHWVRIGARLVTGRRIELPAGTVPGYYLG